MDIEQQLKKVFAETFNIPEEKISASTQQADLPEWDSLAQLRLIMAIESAFNVSFDIDEIPNLDSFSKIWECIKSK